MSKEQYKNNRLCQAYCIYGSDWKSIIKDKRFQFSQDIEENDLQKRWYLLPRDIKTHCESIVRAK